MARHVQVVVGKDRVAANEDGVVAWQRHAFTGSSGENGRGVPIHRKTDVSQLALEAVAANHKHLPKTTQQ